ncbi:MAG: motility associated factor glycosyltransferase family protein [Phycisphaerae bacterium]
MQTSVGTAQSCCAVQPDQQLFCKNMAALWRRDAHLAQQIDDLPVDARLEVLPTRSGQPTARLKTAQGRSLLLHSRYDPLAEAHRFVAGIELNDAWCIVVAGLGLGYHVVALFERLKGDAFIVVTEPDLVVIKTALELVDLSGPIGSGKLVLLTRADVALLHERLEPYSTTMMMGLQFVVHPASQQAAGQFHSALRSMLTNFATYCRTSLMTLVNNARITCKNVAYNLPTYLASPPIDVLHRRFGGYPAIVVAAGPSLSRNIHLLHQAKGRAVICCVQTVFRMLLRLGIVPDFVTSLDYHEISKRFFEDIDDFGQVHLVAEPKATWHVIDTYRGAISLLENSFARRCLGDRLAARGSLRAGSTVAHLAFYLAEYLGCDPIILVGQDLGFSDGLYYSPGAAIHDAWRAELNRFHTIEMKEWERIARHRPMLRKAEDIHGRAIYTDEQMFTYAQQFERDFAASNCRVIDATEGGISKAGAQTMPLAEALRRFCSRTIPPERFAYKRQLKWFDASKLPAGRQAIADKLARLGRLRELARETLGLLQEMKELVDQPRQFNRRIVRVDELRSLVRRDDLIFRMVSDVSQLAELRRFAADARLGSVEADGPERARRQLARDIEFVNGIIEGADALEDILTGSLERFDQAIRAHQPSREPTVCS